MPGSAWSRFTGSQKTDAAEACKSEIAADLARLDATRSEAGRIRQIDIADLLPRLEGKFKSAASRREPIRAACEQIFSEVIERSEERREQRAADPLAAAAEALVSACNAGRRGDSLVRRRVDALLRAYRRSGRRDEVGRTYLEVAAENLRDGCGPDLVSAVQEELGAAAPRQEPANDAAHLFEGNGSKSLGDISVSRESVLQWTHDASGNFPGFTVIGFTADFSRSIVIDSTESDGESAVSPGDYQDVQVSATGDWTIEIVPG